jgi:hypothetical protein
MPWHDETPWARRKSDAQAKEYERLDRHIRTAATVRELVHWDLVRVKAKLSKEHDIALRQEAAKRLRQLTEAVA